MSAPREISSGLGLLLVLALVGCAQEEVVTPTRYLERPNAVDFFCVGYVTADSDTLTGLPVEACAEEVVPEGVSRWLFGLVVNSARSEVAMVDFSSGALVDLANQNPGYGFIPVGENPVGVRLTEDGCAAYVTNHGSCDISVVNINRTLHASGLDVDPDSAPGAATGRIAVRTPSGRLLARPHELVLRPEYLGTDPPVRQCTNLEGHRAYVSLPGCGLVVEMDLDSGRVLQSLKFVDGSVQQAGVDPRCPAECVDWLGEGAVGGDLAENRPGPLLVTSDGLRLLVGSLTRPEITIVDLDIVNGQFLNPRTVPLAAEDRGVRRIRQSPYTWKNDWYFFYVVSRSGAIHVLDADLEEECETNPDPTDPFFPDRLDVDPAQWDAWEPAKGCLALSDPDTPERAPGVESPAIRLPGERMAVDVAFTELFHEGYETEPDSLLAPYYLGGTFAYAVTVDGVAFLVNVDEIYPGELDSPPDLTVLNHRRGDGVHAILSHQLRTARNTDTSGEYDGRPRVDPEDPQQLWADGERVLEEDLFLHDHLAPGAVPTVDILDPYRASTESWSLTYMGVLPRADRASGQLVRDDLEDLGPDLAELRDAGVGFCWAGVRDGDVLELAGCGSDSDCNLGYYCYRSFLQPLGTDGICLASDARATLEDRCEVLAITSRRWEVLRAEDDRLLIGPLEVTDATACLAEDLAGFCCAAEGNDSSSGDIAGILSGGRCVASPMPDLAYTATLDGGDTRLASCFEGLLRYVVRVGPEQYLLVGSRSGVQVEGVGDEGDGNHCVADPGASPVEVSRVDRVDGLVFRNGVFSFELTLGTGVSPEPDYNIVFDITSGFEPEMVDLSARLPATVEAGPDGNLYVIDEGDENVTGGLQGQVLRLLPGDIALDTGFVVR